MWKHFLRPWLFLFDAEKVHGRAIRALSFLSRISLARRFGQKALFMDDPRLATRIGNLDLRNPVGLAAGFDKNIEAPLAYSMCGFGFVEFGSITCSEEAGNSKPRLWRLPPDRGLIVNYGLANCGATKAKARLRSLKKQGEKMTIPFGVSIAPDVNSPGNSMLEDYERALLELSPYSDYVTLNASCPNVRHYCVVARTDFIDSLLQRVAALRSKMEKSTDIFIKIGSDLKDKELAAIVDSCLRYQITGIVATNLIKDRTGIKALSPYSALNHPGGISGKLLFEKSNNIISKIYRFSGGKLKIIGVGGVFTAEDAYKKILLGASAVQLITGWIYGGPPAIRRINIGLLSLLKRDGFKNVAAAVGAGS